MSETTRALIDIFLMFAAAHAFGHLFALMRQPAVIGELMAGVLIGPHVLGWLQPAPFHEVLAELGAVFLLFAVGLETHVGALRAVGKTAMLAAVAGTVLPFAFGYGLLAALGGSQTQALFLGASMVATSVGITARVLADLGLLRSREARIILGAAVIDDVLAMLLVAVVAGLAQGGVTPGSVALLTLEALGFVVVAAVFGTRAARAGAPAMGRAADHSKLFGLALLLCLGLAALAGVIGLAAIIGAFLAGMALAETTEHWDLERRIEPIRGFLVPFFFVVMGSHVDPAALFNGRSLGLTAAVAALAAAGKFLGCGAAAWPLGRRSAAFVGVGMTPRGEVGLIVAGLGLTLGVFTQSLYSVVVTMVILSTVAVPPVLKIMAPRAPAAEPAPREGGLAADAA